MPLPAGAQPRALTLTGCLTVFTDEPCPFQQLIDHLTGQPHGRLDVNKQSRHSPLGCPLERLFCHSVLYPCADSVSHKEVDCRRLFEEFEWHRRKGDRRLFRKVKHRSDQVSCFLAPCTRPYHVEPVAQLMQPPPASVRQVDRFVVFREKPVWIEVSGDLIETIRIEYAINVDQEQRLCAGV